MLSLFIVTSVIAVALMAYIALEPLVANYGRFSKPFRLACPEKRVDADVKVKTAVAAMSRAYGPAVLEVAHCSLLSRGSTCDERCLRGLAA